MDKRVLQSEPVYCGKHVHVQTWVLPDNVFTDRKPLLLHVICGVQYAYVDGPPKRNA